MKRKRAVLLAGVAAAVTIGLLGGLAGHESSSAEQPSPEMTVPCSTQQVKAEAPSLMVKREAA